MADCIGIHVMFPTCLNSIPTMSNPSLTGITNTLKYRILRQTSSAPAAAATATSTGEKGEKKSKEKKAATDGAEGAKKEKVPTRKELAIAAQAAAAVCTSSFRACLIHSTHSLIHMCNGY
jgi:hypothetical protein